VPDPTVTEHTPHATSVAGGSAQRAVLSMPHFYTLLFDCLNHFSKCAAILRSHGASGEKCGWD